MTHYFAGHGTPYSPIVLLDDEDYVNHVDPAQPVASSSSTGDRHDRKRKRPPSPTPSATQGAVSSTGSSARKIHKIDTHGTAPQESKKARKKRRKAERDAIQRALANKYQTSSRNHNPNHFHYSDDHDNTEDSSALGRALAKARSNPMHPDNVGPQAQLPVQPAFSPPMHMPWDMVMLAPHFAPSFPQPASNNWNPASLPTVPEAESAELIPSHPTFGIGGLPPMPRQPEGVPSVAPPPSFGNPRSPLLATPTPAAVRSAPSFGIPSSASNLIDGKPSRWPSFSSRSADANPPGRPLSPLARDVMDYDRAPPHSGSSKGKGKAIATQDRPSPIPRPSSSAFPLPRESPNLLAEPHKVSQGSTSAQSTTQSIQPPPTAQDSQDPAPLRAAPKKIGFPPPPSPSSHLGTFILTHAGVQTLEVGDPVSSKGKGKVKKKKTKEFTPNPACTLVLEQLPKQRRNISWVKQWAEGVSARGEKKTKHKNTVKFVALDGKLAKALVEFSSAAAAREAWESDRPAQELANLPSSRLKGLPRDDLIKAFYFRIPNIVWGGDGGGVGDLEEGEVSDDDETASDKLAGKTAAKHLPQAQDVPMLGDFDDEDVMMEMDISPPPRSPLALASAPPPPPPIPVSAPVPSYPMQVPPALPRRQPKSGIAALPPKPFAPLPSEDSNLSLDAQHGMAIDDSLLLEFGDLDSSRPRLEKTRQLNIPLPPLSSSLPARPSSSTQTLSYSLSSAVHRGANQRDASREKALPTGPRAFQGVPTGPKGMRMLGSPSLSPTPQSSVPTPWINEDHEHDVQSLPERDDLKDEERRNKEEEQTKTSRLMDLEERIAREKVRLSMKTGRKAGFAKLDTSGEEQVLAGSSTSRTVSSISTEDPAASGNTSPGSLEDLAESFLSQTFGDLATPAPAPSTAFTIAPAAELAQESSFVQLGDRQQRLEAHIQESKDLMDRLMKTKNKEEKSEIMRHIRQGKKQWEEQEAVFANAPKKTIKAPAWLTAQKTSFKWPSTRVEDSVLILSDDDESDDEDGNMDE